MAAPLLFSAAGNGYWGCEGSQATALARMNRWLRQLSSEVWMRFSCLVAALTILLVAGHAIAAEPKLKAVIVDGLNNHDWAAATNAIQTILDGSGRFSVDVSTWPRLPDFSRYDVVIDNYNGGHLETGTEWPPEAQRALENYVANGGGLVVFHAANNAFLKWPEFNRMIGLGWRAPTFGPSLAIGLNGQVFLVPQGQGLPPGHDQRHDFEIFVRDADHPVT